MGLESVSASEDVIGDLLYDRRCDTGGIHARWDVGNYLQLKRGPRPKEIWHHMINTVDSCISCHGDIAQ